MEEAAEMLRVYVTGEQVNQLCYVGQARLVTAVCAPKVDEVASLFLHQVHPYTVVS
jgi:hypothetical protein